MTVECEIAKITIEVGGEASSLEVPAYTRQPDQLRELAIQILDQYLEDQLADGSLGSIADYAMRLLAESASEPRFMEEP